MIITRKTVYWAVHRGGIGVALAFAAAGTVFAVLGMKLETGLMFGAAFVSTLNVVMFRLVWQDGWLTGNYDTRNAYREAVEHADTGDQVEILSRLGFAPEPWERMVKDMKEEKY